MSCEVTFFRASSQAPFALLKTEVCFVQHVHSHLFFARLKKCLKIHIVFLGRICYNSVTGKQ